MGAARDVLRRAMACGLSALLIAFVAMPPAAAKDKKRHRDQGKPALGGATGAGQTEESDDRRREDPDETPEQRRARQERTLRGKDRKAILVVLAELHEEETAAARDMLVAYAKRTRSDAMKAEALRALGWRGNRAALDFLKGKHGLESIRVTVAAAACRAVGKVGDPATRPLLLERVTSENGQLAAAALAGLVALDRRAPDLMALIDLGLEHSAIVVRVEAIAALGVVKTDRWRELLVPLAEDPVPDVRVAVCDALAKRRDEESVGLLMKLQSDDPEPSVREAAKRAMLVIDASLDEG